MSYLFLVFILTPYVMLAPYKKQIKSVAIDSTFNWYWLVDGLKEHGYQVMLMYTAAVKQYDG